MRRACASVLFTSLVALSCGRATLPQQGEVVLYIDTDAPLPSPPGAPAPPVGPLFDTLRIDVFPPGTQTPCSGCTNVFALDGVKVNSGQVSLGIVPRPNVSGYHVRARLYLATSAQDGIPSPDATVDVTAALPTVGADGVEERSLFLHVDDVASPLQGTLTTGAVVTGHAGTWPGAQRVPCAGSAPAGQVCVPGGAYWMGNPFAVIGAIPGESADHQRIVVLPPFFLDAHEVTVSDFRAQGATTTEWWSGSNAGMQPSDWCTFTGAPSSNDELPVNCIEWDAARSFCRDRGGDLETEAQYEYVAGGLVSALYVWGDDAPTCGDARFGVSGFGILAGAGDAQCQGPTAAFGGPLAPARPGRLDRDQLVLPTGTIVDLAGNLEEWVLDDWQPQGSACWPSGVLHSPVCAAPALAKTKSVRGASWGDPPSALRAATANSVSPVSNVSPFTGFRCARRADVAASDAGTPFDGGARPDASGCVAVEVTETTPTGPACPASASGSCGVADVSAFTPTWVPPSGYHQGLCTAAEIAAFYTDCIDAQPNSTTCALFLEGHPACFECIESYEADDHYGPLVITANGVISGNSAGCVALLEPCNLPCAQAMLAQSECEIAACVSSCPPDTTAGTGAYDACTSAADNCAPSGCAKFYDAAACQGSLSGPAHPASACLPGASLEAFYNVAVPLFCGE